jgi:DNA topoisomerase-1
LIRVGNDDYAKQNNSYGLTTLKNRHVAVDGNEVRFRFTGKSGKQWSLHVRDRRVAKIIRACQDLPGQELIQYVDEQGVCHDVTSTDVNDYLREITGKDITAKDFRTWAGTVLAAMALSEFESFDSAAQAKRNLRSAIEKVSARLGNTPTICRKCYVHPEVLNSYMDGKLVLQIKSEAESELRSAVGSLKAEEAAVLAILRTRLAKEVEPWQVQLCNEEAVPRERSCKRHSSLNCPTEIAHTSVSYDLILAAPNGGLLLPAFIAQKVTNKVTC